MASNSRRDHIMRLHRRNRESLSNQHVLAVDDDGIDETAGATCIDLAVDVSNDDIIDLTRSNISIIDSPVVVLTPADDVGPLRGRRGSGRRGRRRNSLGRRLFSARSRSPLQPEVHILHSDSESDDLPDVPFEIPQQDSSVNASILQSQEGVKISCPICLDDTKQIQKTGRHIVSTICGHIFCDACIKATLNTHHACPTCRKKLTLKNIHPLFF